MNVIWLVSTVMNVLAETENPFGQRDGRTEAAKYVHMKVSWLNIIHMRRMFWLRCRWRRRRWLQSIYSTMYCIMLYLLWMYFLIPRLNRTRKYFFNSGQTHIVSKDGSADLLLELRVNQLDRISPISRKLHPSSNITRTRVPR